MARKAEMEDRFEPVAFDPKAHAAKERKTDPGFCAASAASHRSLLADALCRLLNVAVVSIALDA